MEIEIYYCGDKRLTEKQESFLSELASLFAKYSYVMMEPGAVREISMVTNETTEPFISNLDTTFHGDVCNDFVLNACLGPNGDWSHQIDVIAIVE